MSRPWFPFYVGDYIRKTAHLSLLEHGAYHLLIDHYMGTAYPLPNDPAKLYRICRARSPSERKAVMLVASEFFTQNGTLLRNKKCDSELDKQLKFSESQRSNVMKRYNHGTTERLPAHATTTTTTPISKKESIVLGSESQNSDSSPQTKKKLPSGRGTRLNSEWKLPDEWGEWAETLGMKRIEIITEQDKFRDYWIAATGAKSSKADWQATWRNWIRNHLERKQNHAVRR